MSNDPSRRQDGGFPTVRMRRLRSSGIRDLVVETSLGPSDFIYPLFVREDAREREPVASMPGVHRHTVDGCVDEAREAWTDGVRAILLFGIPAERDAVGSGAYAEDGVIQVAVGALKEALPEMVVVTDVCLCEYTSHGHCGVVEDGRVMNDATLELLARQAVSHGRAGADVVAPSDMMDGRVGAIRGALDGEGLRNTAILSYSVKYASAFYGPFRDAAGSAPAFGDRRGYQMDPANSDEALREVALDLREGADIVMVKPALAYLDVLYRVKREFGVPTAAYSVSGEYSMIRAAHRQGWLDGEAVTHEVALAARRAGADLVVTYAARSLARSVREGRTTGGRMETTAEEDAG